MNRCSVKGRCAIMPWSFGIGTDASISVLYNASTYRDEAGKVIGVFAAARDITERKRAEAAVLAERQRLFDVLETLPAMIRLLTPDYHVAFANRSFREKFGEPDGRHCYEYCFGRTEPCEFCESYNVLKTGRPHHWEVTGADGSVIAAHDFPFTDVDGSPMILEMDMDITEQRKAEAGLKEVNERLEQRVAERTAALRESQQMMAEAEALSHSCSWEWDLTSGQWTFSDEWHAIHGVPKRKLTVEELLPVAHPDDRNRVIRAMEDAAQRICAYDLERRIVPQDTGEVRVVRARGRFVRDAAGQVVKVHGFTQDITERKRAEDALRESETRFRTLAAVMPVQVFTADRDGACCDYFNEYCIEYSGIPSRSSWAGPGSRSSTPTTCRGMYRVEVPHGRDRRALQERVSAAPRATAPSAGSSTGACPFVTILGG